MGELVPIARRALAPIRRAAGAAAGAAATIRTSLAVLARAHLAGGRVRMMPIYDRTDVEWIDQHGQHHRRIEQDWIGLAWFRDGQLVHEIRWGRRGAGHAIEAERPFKIPDHHPGDNP